MTSVIHVTRINYESYLEAILEIENASFPSPWSRNAFVQEFGNPVSHLWASVEDDVLVGYICFWMFDSEIQLINVAVQPEKREKGFGQDLLRKMIETGVAKGMHYVWLEVRTSNLPARRLYEKLGFAVVGRRSGYYRDTKEDAMVMSLPLSERPTYRRVSN
jgi:ribosomal-protein-alanine N-acetyltransferase